MSTVSPAYPKPPLGAKPGWICAADRISELAGAIQRYADEAHGSDRRTFIREWAEEILMQCDIWDMITEREKYSIGEEV